MPSAQINFVEFGSASPPASAARVVAKVGVCSKGTPDTVYAFDVTGSVAGALGEGPLTEATAQAVRVSKQRTLALPLLASAPGMLGAVQKSGSGPKITVTGSPQDTAEVSVKITKGGASGVGRFRVSISSTVAGAQITPLYLGELTIPARRQAEISGTRNLATLTYARAAMAIGAADLRAPALFGVGGSLDQKEVSAKIDGAAAVTCKLNAPADADALLAQLHAAFVSCTFTLLATHRLAWSTRTLGEKANLEIIGGSALPPLGLVAVTLEGAPGDLDGETLTLREDTEPEQTIEFSPPPANPADVVALVATAANITASLVAPASKLRIMSDTLGESTLR